jgi:hypothetical protein
LLVLGIGANGHVGLWAGRVIRAYHRARLTAARGVPTLDCSQVGRRWCRASVVDGDGNNSRRAGHLLIARGAEGARHQRNALGRITPSLPASFSSYMRTFN